MKKNRYGYLVILISVISGNLIFAQTDQDDYWLDNGFTSGQTVIANTGFFYDDGGDSLYATNQNWNVRFCSENGNPITLDFSGFRTDYRGPWPALPTSYLAYDYMTINTGTPPQLVAYNDDTPQFSFTSPSGCIRFGFVSQISSLRDSGWVAEISANPPPVNNDPCDAIDLEVGSTCSPGFYSNKGAYNTTTLGSPACHTYYGGDVWFTTTVPSSGEVKIETIAGSLNYAIMALYTGTCSSLTELDCVDNASDMPSIILSGRTPGEVIYIRLFGDQAKSGTFGICVTDPSAEIIGYSGPGGVGDSTSNVFWYKADEGVLDASDNPVTDGVSVKTWQDLSGRDNHLEQTTASLQAVLDEDGLNNFPALSFDGIDDLFSLELGATSAPLNLFAVTNFGSANDETLIAIGDANDDNTFSLGRETDSSYYSYSFSSKRYGPKFGTSPVIINPVHSTASPYHNISLDGTSGTVDDYGSAITTDGSMYLGSSKDSDRYFSGNLSELFMYDKSLNEAQEIIVLNYLSASYNIDISTLDRFDYESVHYHDLAGIGRVDQDNTHTKAQSAGILSAGGPTDLDDDEFMFFGHDNGDFTSWTSTEVPDADPDLMRLAREWRVDISGTNDSIGNVDIGVEISSLPGLPSGFDVYLIMVDSDGDFSSGADIYGMATFDDEYIASDVSLETGDYIALLCVNLEVEFTNTSSEGLESIEHPGFEVAFNYPVSNQIEVGYRISAGTASGGGVDFSLNDDVLVFTGGEMSHDIIPFILDDTIVEIPDEYFIVELYSVPSGINIGPQNEYTYTINDDDILISIVASDTIIGECSESTTELTATVFGQEPLTYSWSPSADLSHPDSSWTEASPSASTRYYLTVTDALFNSYTDSIDIEVIPGPSQPSVTVTGSLVFCQGDSVLLRSDTATSYLWSNGETTREIAVQNSGDYSVIVYDEYGCSSTASDIVTVVVNSLPDQPTISALSATAFCDGGSVELTTDASDSYLWSTGETSQNIVVSTTSSITVQVIDANLCYSIPSEALDITAYPLPTKPVVTVTGDLEFCEGGSVGLSTSVMEGYLWSTGETTQGITVSTSGKYAVVVTDANSCSSPASDSVEVIVNPLPSKPAITVTGDLEFCEGGNVDLSTGAMDSYLWSTGETTQGITVSTSGKYAVVVTDANSCTSPASDSVEVIVNPVPAKPVITALSATTFCEGGSVELTTDAADSYLWSTGETTQNIIVTNTGSYTVQVSNSSSCQSVSSDPVDVVVNSLPTKPVINIAGDLEFCDGGSVELGTTAMDGYLWSTGETTQGIIVSTSGKYAVVVTDANSCSSPASDSVEVIVNPVPAKPDITALSATTICEGESVELTTDAADSYLWSTGETTQNITVTTAGSYTVQVSNSSSCQSLASDPVDVTVNSLPAKPLISVTGDLEFCEDGSVELSTGIMDGYLWSTGESTQSITVATSGKYAVVVSDANSCSSPASDSVEVIVNTLPSKPVISAQPATTICDGESVTLTTDVSDSYLWSTGETTESINVNTTGSFTVELIDINSCHSESSDPILITVLSNPDKPTITALSATEFCEGETVELVSSSSDTYLWSTGETTSSIIISESGDYSVTVSNAGGCTSVSSDITTVIVHSLPAKPVISPAGPISMITGDSIQLTTDIADSYLWSNGSADPAIYVKETGSYTVQVFDTYSCPSPVSDPVVVNVGDFYPAPEVTVNGGLTICQGESTDLICEDAYAYLWSNGETTKSITITDAGEYTVVISDDLGRESLPSATITLVVKPLPEVEITLTEVSCYGGNNGTATASASGGDEPYVYLWSNSGTGSSQSNLLAGNYSLTVSDANSCQTVENFEIIQPDEILISETITQPYCPDADDGEISIEVSGGTPPYSYLWDQGSTSSSITGLISGSYELEVTDNNNCTVSDIFQLSYTSSICFEIPTIITPNNDSKNDEWIIEGLEFYPDVTVEIYDRWGKRVFYSKGYSRNWDGTFEGRDLPMDSYHYVINLNNGMPVIIGNITIVR